MATVHKSVSRKTNTKEVSTLEKRISRIQECYKFGQRVLKECEPYSAKEELERVAAKIGIKPEQAAKYRAMAIEETGYSEQDIVDSVTAFRTEGRALTIGHFIRLLTVRDKKKREKLEGKALKNQWSLRRLQQEILADCGRRYDVPGRRPKIPDNLKSAVGSVAHQVWSWRHWLDAYLEAEVSNKNAKLKKQLQELSSQMRKVYESIEPPKNFNDVRKKKDVKSAPRSKSASRS